MSPKKQPEPQEPAVQRLRFRYTKRGRLRFTSHRDFARALERALRRADVPIAYSSGFHPHPRVSYQSAAPTGVASEAEYAELALRREAEPAEMAKALDEALPDGLDILEAVEARTSGFADRMEASRWRIELPEITGERLDEAVAAFLAAETVTVTRLTKKGNRAFDARKAVVSARTEPVARAASATCAILDLVVRQVTPAVRPDDVLSGLSLVANLELPVPPRVTRLAQGPLTESGDIADPLHADRVHPRDSAGGLPLDPMPRGDVRPASGRIRPGRRRRTPLTRAGSALRVFRDEQKKTSVPPAGGAS